VSGFAAARPPSCWGATAVSSFPASRGRPVYDGAVTGARRRAPDPHVPVLSILILAVVAACGSATPTRTPALPSSIPSVAPSLTPVPGGQSGPPSTASDLPTTTDVDGFGPIWDALPASFPRPAGTVAAELPEPASALFGLPLGDPRSVSLSEGEALTTAGWSVNIGSPLEDGTVVIDATGPGDGCIARIRFTPASGGVIMHVLYGAHCPFD